MPAVRFRRSGGEVDCQLSSLLPLRHDDTDERSLRIMSTVRYTEEDQIPGSGGRWIAAPPPPRPTPAPAAAVTPTATNPTPLLFRAYRRSFPGQPHRQHDSYVWIEIDSSSLLEPLRRTFPSLGTLYDPKPAVRLMPSFFFFFLSFTLHFLPLGLLHVVQGGSFRACETVGKPKGERERQDEADTPLVTFCVFAD